jgi:CRISPR/Cas system-associated exonuclease Cas4 (RecB family)
MSKRKYEFTEIAGWSFSRFDNFQSCRRQYYFDYYGKKFAPPEIRERVDFLKSLQSPALLVGQIIHEAIATNIKNIQQESQEVSLEILKEETGHAFSKALESSLLIDSYYGSELTPAKKFSLKIKLDTCLESFYASKWYSFIRSLPGKKKLSWIIEPEDFGEFRLDGMKAYARVDFAFPDDDGSLVIIDWKTGKRYEKKHALQMQGYILYIHDICGHPLEKIKAVLEYLADDGESLESQMTQEDLGSFRKRVKKQLAELHAMCQDVEKNVPLQMESFPLCANHRFCSWCKYRELCNRY